jgi:GNAT superfamily N-acetyltransferase
VNEFTVRAFAPDEWAAMRQIRLAALADAPGAFTSTLEREQGFDESRWLERIAPGGSFGAWAGTEMVGIASCFPDDDPDFPVPDAWQLVGMWVSPPYRGSGVADRIVTAVGEHVESAGARTLVLWVIEVNGRARAFYQRLGLHPTGGRQLARPDQPDSWEIQLSRELPAP